MIRQDGAQAAKRALPSIPEAGVGAIQNLYDSVDSSPKAEKLQAAITSIDIAHEVAFVRLEASNWNGNAWKSKFGGMEAKTKSGFPGRLAPCNLYR